MSIKRSPNSFIWATATGVPFTQQRLRPLTSTVRRMRSVSLSSSPAASSHALARAVIENSAVTSVRSAPSRMTPVSLRPPKTNCRASIRMDLPAPVSPVRQVSPVLASIVRVGTMTKSLSDKSVSMFFSEEEIRAGRDPQFWCGLPACESDARPAGGNSI